MTERVDMRDDRQILGIENQHIDMRIHDINKTMNSFNGNVDLMMFQLKKNSNLEFEKRDKNKKKKG